MEVILLEKVQNLGDLGDRVKVKAGYGRNWLLPQGKALRANNSNIAEFEQRREQLEREAREQAQSAEQRGEAMRGRSVTIKARVGPENRLYGSVGPAEVAEALAAEGLNVEKKEIQFRETQGVIRAVGEYEVTVALHADVEVPLTVVVEPQ